MANQPRGYQPMQKPQNFPVQPGMQQAGMQQSGMQQKMGMQIPPPPQSKPPPLSLPADLLPVSISFPTEAERRLVEQVVNYVPRITDQLRFKLAPAYTLYLMLRVCHREIEAAGVCLIVNRNHNIFFHFLFCEY